MLASGPRRWYCTRLHVIAPIHIETYTPILSFEVGRDLLRPSQLLSFPSLALYLFIYTIFRIYQTYRRLFCNYCTVTIYLHLTAEHMYILLHFNFSLQGSHPDSLYRVPNDSDADASKLSRMFRTLRWPVALIVICVALAVFVYFLMPGKLW